jgi:hypothetical protein
MIRRVGERRRTGKPDENSADSSLARIRERLRDGYYDSPSIIHEVARRILGSGDLRPAC